MTFSLEKATLWIEDYIFSLKKRFEDKDILKIDSFTTKTLLVDWLVLCGLLVDFCDVFISSLDSRSDT